MQDTDLVVVGAGIHGVGVAQAAAAAGHSVLVLEERCPAAGTSSRSSKLIHGGLRYLETLQFGLVRESLDERAILLEVAPHLVKLVPFHVPVYRSTSRRPWKVRLGLSLYALLGGLHKDSRFSTVPPAEWEKLDGLSCDGLQTVFRYYDGQTDDAALVRAVLASALSLGARAEIPGAFLAAERVDDAWNVRYRVADEERGVRARVVVNAAGPWANRVLERVKGGARSREMELVSGAHVEFEGAIERGIYYTESPSDRRAVFVMPWKGRTLVGTTETPFDGDPADVAPTDAEIDYLEAILRRYFPCHAARRLNAFAGLRVLPRGKGRAFDRPREVVLQTDDRQRPTLLTIYGGKLTGYRHTAESVLHVLHASLPRRQRRADTRTLVLPAGVSQD